jgi:hypothetical protein
LSVSTECSIHRQSSKPKLLAQAKKKLPVVHMPMCVCTRCSRVGAPVSDEVVMNLNHTAGNLSRMGLCGRGGSLGLARKSPHRGQCGQCFSPALGSGHGTTVACGLWLWIFREAFALEMCVSPITKESRCALSFGVKTTAQ